MINEIGQQKWKLCWKQCYSFKMISGGFKLVSLIWWESCFTNLWVERFSKIQLLKGIVHPKKESFIIIYSLSCCSKPVWVSFLCWTLKKIFWRMLVIKQVMVPIALHSIYFSTMEVNGNQHIYMFGTTWGWVNDDRIKTFWVNYSFKLMLLQHFITAHYIFFPKSSCSYLKDSSK